MEPYFHSKISPSYNELKQFLKSQIKVDDNTKEYANIFSQQQECGITHLILDKTIVKGILDLPKKSSYETFLNYLWKCYLDGITLRWFEKQFYKIKNKSPVDSSGLMIDFDIYQKPGNKVISNYWGIIKNISITLNKYLNFGYELFSTYAVVINKPELVEVEKEKYKDGFHILFPGIHINKQTKMFILKKFSESCAEGFDKMGIINSKEAVDVNSAFVPVQIYGNCRKGKVPHKFDSLYEITFNPYNEEPSIAIKNGIFDYVKRGKKSKASYKYNLCLELSLHVEGKLIKNRDVKIKPEYEKSIIMFTNAVSNCRAANLNNRLDGELRNLINNDVEAFELSKLIDILDPKRGTDYKTWYQTCKLISQINTDYKVIAYKFSAASCPEKWNDGARKTIDSIFEQTKNEFAQPKCDIKQIKKRARGLINLSAKNDNLKEYNRINNNTSFERIRRLAFECGGNLNDTQIAIIVKILCNGNYVYCPYQIAGFRSAGKWYEFIIEKKAIEPANKLYVGRWKERISFPVSLDVIISQEVGKYIKTVADWIESKSQEESEDRGKPMMIMAKNLRNVAHRCGNTRNINSIKSRCMDNIFNYEGFETKLNLKNNLLGVANGVLKITNDGVKLLKHSEDSYVSRTCGTVFKPYDPENEYIKETNKIINTIFPNKCDRDAIMMWISTALIFCNKKVRNDLVFLILYSGGGSGKTVLCDLIQNAFGVIGTLGYNETYGHSYSTSSSFFISEKKDPNSADNHVINFRYARIIICPEGKGGKLNFTRVKQFSDSISARGLYQKNKSMKIGALAIYPTNEEPTFSHIDYSVTRRLLYYKMPMKFVEKLPPDNTNKFVAKRDPTINHKVHKPEYGSAFLSILINYYHRLHKEYNGDIFKVIENSNVAKQTKSYINRNDTVSQFINERFVKDESSKMHIDVVVREYIEWYQNYKDKTAKIIGSEYITDFREHSKLRDYVVETNKSIIIKGWRIMSTTEYEEKNKENK